MDRPLAKPALRIPPLPASLGLACMAVGAVVLIGLTTLALVPLLLGLGLLAAWIGLQIRRNMPESALYELAKTEDRLLHNPIRTVFAQHKREVLLGLAVLLPMTCCFFFAFVYFNTFMMSELHFPASRALVITSIGLMLSLSATLLAGWMADRWGYKAIQSCQCLFGEVIT